MQRPLGFLRIDAHEHRAQTQRIAQQVLEQLPPPPLAPLPKRPPGRPKRQRSADEALNTAAAAPAAAAAAATAAAAAADPAAGTVSKRARHYTHWLESPYINDILSAYRRTNGSAKRAVTLLRGEAPDDRYAHLAHSTISSWFGPDKQLLRRFRAQLEDGVARGRGSERALSGAPLVEAEIKQVLLQMRTSGAPVNSRVIRWVMRAVMTDMQPALLSGLTLSQSFISRWAREQLQWRWRARTTTASKLPLDWEEQGVLMSQRIAATMEMHKVRASPLTEKLKMGVLKPLVLQWCVESWSELRERKLVVDGWHSCCTSLFNVNDPAKRHEAVAAVARQQLNLASVPDDEDQASAAAASSESEDELDVSTPRAFGKQSTRARKPPASFGYQLSSDAIALSDDDSD